MDIEPSTKEELAKLGTQALKDLYENLAGAKQFVLAQAPDICQQMIAWQIAQGCMGIVLFLVICAVAVVFAMRVWQFKDSDGDPAGKAIGVIILCIGALVSAVVWAHVIIPSIQAIVAPKLFLLERIAAMLR